jgi:hypothetical protein
MEKQIGKLRIVTGSPILFFFCPCQLSKPMERPLAQRPAKCNSRTLKQNEQVHLQPTATESEDSEAYRGPTNSRSEQPGHSIEPRSNHSAM